MAWDMICGFLAYSWKLHAYSGALLITVAFGSFLLTVVFGSLFCLQLELFCLQWESGSKKRLKRL